MSDPTPQTEPQTPPEGQQQPAPGQQAQQPAGEQHVPYKRFQEVNDKYTALKQQLATLTGEKEQQQQAQQTLEQRLAAIEAERNQERAARQRLEVATHKKLPPELADRLVGATPEELAADAERLLAFLKPASGPGVPPSGSGGRPAKLDLSSMTPAQIRQAADEGKI
jgi:predicted RNase H-like nuclease (RuvC/YqgF family)